MLQMQQSYIMKLLFIMQVFTLISQYVFFQKTYLVENVNVGHNVFFKYTCFVIYSIYISCPLDFILFGILCTTFYHFLVLQNIILNIYGTNITFLIF